MQIQHLVRVVVIFKFTICPKLLCFFLFLGHAEKHYRKVAQERRDKEERSKELRKELQTGRSSDAQKVS